MLISRTRASSTNRLLHLLRERGFKPQRNNSVVGYWIQFEAVKIHDVIMKAKYLYVEGMLALATVQSERYTHLHSFAPVSLPSPLRIRSQIGNLFNHGERLSELITCHAQSSTKPSSAFLTQPSFFCIPQSADAKMQLRLSHDHFLHIEVHHKISWNRKLSHQN